MHPLISFYKYYDRDLFVDSHGELPKLKEFDQSIELGGFAIGAFKDADGSLGGTGFIFNVCSGVSPVKAFILIAAHVFIDNFEYKPEPTDFLIGGNIYEALPLKILLTGKFSFALL